MMIMKTTQYFVMAMLLLSTSIGHAQSRKDAFWVIEGNPKNQHHVLVRFYAGDRRLIGEERMERAWIDLGRKRNLRLLNRKLQKQLDLDSITRMAAVKKN